MRPAGIPNSLVSITPVPDPELGHGSGEDNPARQPVEQRTAALWLLPDQPAGRLVLTTRGGLRTLAGGAAPTMTVTGLPRHTVRVAFTSAGSEGVRLLSVTDCCLAGAEPQRSTTTARFANGKTATTTLPSSRQLLCGGRFRYIGP